jgi:transcriptional regulator with XRE-family HTH domain
MNLGDKVKELREKAGLTQEELAERMGVQRNTVWRWENQKANLRADNIQRLSSALNIDASEIIDDRYAPELSTHTSTNETYPSLAYWGEVADNARHVAASGDKNAIADVSHLLTRALTSLHVSWRDIAQHAMA